MSDAETIVFQTRPEPPSNLTLEARSPNSLTVKWENPSVVAGQLVNHRHRLSIEAPAISYAAEYFVPGDKNTFNFSKLPDIVGTGEKYTVAVEHLVVPVGGDQEVNSEAIKKVFTTKPLAPSNFKMLPESNEISWTRSATPRVHSYKVFFYIKYKNEKATRFGGKEKREKILIVFFVFLILMTRFVGKEKREKLRRRRSCRLWTRRTLSALSGSRCSFFFSRGIFDLCSVHRIWWMGSSTR